MSDSTQVDHTPQELQDAVRELKSLTGRIEQLEASYDERNGKGASDDAKRKGDPMAPFAEQMESLGEQLKDVQQKLLDGDKARRTNDDGSPKEPQRKGEPNTDDALKAAADRIAGEGGGFNPFAIRGKKYGWANKPALKQLAAMPTEEVRQIMSDGEYDEFKSVMELSDRVYLLGALLNADPRDPTDVRTTKLYAQLDRKLKALDTAESGGGAEWIPTGFSSQLIDRIDLELVVAQVFPRFTMPTNPYTLPVEGGHVEAYLTGESTGDGDDDKVTADDAGTQKVTYDAEKLAVRSLASYEIEEDSIIPVLPYMQRKLVTGLARGVDDAIINGDTSGAHQDSDVTAPTDRRKAWDGLRALALADAKIDLSTFNVENIRSIRSAMGKYAAQPMDNVWFFGVQGHILLLSLKDSQNNPVVITLDKLGPQATILTGMLGSLDGSPVLISEFVRENLNASGVYDGTTTTKKVALNVNRQCYSMGDRRRVMVETDRDIERQQHIIVASWRGDFQCYFDTTSEDCVGLGYNF